MPSIKAVASYICGSVFVINWETDTLELSKKKRTIRCLQEPNPLEHETWDTPGITDKLVPERTTTTNENGEYCFTVSRGLWRITADRTPGEERDGLHWDYGSDRGQIGLVNHEGISNIVIK